jgi:uncharacterized protein (TIGR02099 family)
MLNKSCFLLLRVVWRAVFLSLLAGCLFLILTYTAFWQLAQQRENLSLWLSEILQQPVSLQILKPSWENANPQIRLEDLQIGLHHLQSATVEIDLFATILTQKPILKYISLNGLNISIPTSTTNEHFAPPLLDKEIIELAQKIDPFISQTHLYLENAEFSNAHFKINIKQAEWLKNDEDYILIGQLERFFSDVYIPRTVTNGQLNFKATLNPYSLEATLRLTLQQAELKIANQTFLVPKLQSHWKAQWLETLNVTGQINIPSFDIAMLSAFNLPITSTGLIEDIEITLENNVVTTNFQGNDLIFHIKDIYDDPIKVSHLKTNLIWNENPQFEINLSNEDIENIQIKGSLDAWQAELKNADLSKVYYYIPKKAVGAKKWLSHGLPKGKITSAQAEWKNHQLSASAQVEDGIIDYSIGWQQITHAAADVTFKDNTLTIQAQRGEIANSKILPTTQVVIEHLTTKTPVLTVNGQASGASADGLKFIHESPLEEIIDLQGLNLQGQMDLDLKLVIALGGDKKITTEGKIDLKNNKLSNDLLIKKDLPLTDLNGTVYFNKEGLHTEEIEAKLLGYPVELDIERTKENGLQIDLNGTADRVFLERLFQRLNPKIMPFLWHLSGQTDWNAHINYPIEDAPTLEITSDLEGAAISLPQPLGKIADQERFLRYQIPLEEDEEGIFQYANLFNGIFNTDFRKGTFQWGEKLAKLENRTGWTIKGNFPEIDINNWLFLFDNTSQTSSNEIPAMYVDISTPSLKFANQHWQPFSLKGDLKNLSIDSNKIKGKINYNNELLKIDLNHLHINAPNHKTQTSQNIPELENRETVYQNIRFDPRQLPNIQFKCRELKINDLNLGDWRFQATPIENGLNIDRLQAHTDHVDILASGSWQANPYWTSLQMELSSDDFGKGLNQLGYGSGAMSGGKVKATFQGNYPGDPLQFDRGYLQGELDLNISDGRLEDVNPGVGRIFGLFDLYAAPRRLFLDFGDVLGKGLEFENIRGHFKFAEGFAETKGLTLESTMSKVIFRGKTDLRRHLYDQIMIVMPHIENALSVASLSLGGIGIGLKAATFLLQSMLKDELNQIIQFRYRITDSWEKPKIEMVE